MASSPSKILIGLPLDPDDSKQLLSWAIRVLAHPHDTIVALHVLVGEDKKKRKKKKKKRDSVTRRQSQLRQAKAYVISVLGEFARACWCKQVNLEAKVAFSSQVGGGLVEEAKSTSADFLLLRGSRNQSIKIKDSDGITKYCFENVHESCTVVSVGKSFSSNSSNSQGNYEPSSRRFKIDKQSDKEASPVLKDFISDSKTQTRSPRTVLDALEGQSNSTEDDTFSTRVSSVTDTTSSLTPKIKSQSKLRKSQSPFRLIASFLGSPLRRKNSNISKNEKRQPLLKCFSYEEIFNATNGFRHGNTAFKTLVIVL